jgi:hypothetical protein
MLNGQYAAVLQGFQGSGIGTPVAIAGSFHADGAGTITAGGDFDINNANGVTHGTNNASSYTVGLDPTSSGNLGCVVLSLSNGSTTAFRFSLGGLSSNVFSKGRIIEYDDATGAGTRVSGVLRLQDTTSFALSQLQPRYAYGTDAALFNGGHFASAGSFTVDTSGNITDGFDDNSFLGYTTGGYGTIGTISTTTGRATMTLILGGYQTTTDAIYMVDADEVFIVGTDTANPAYSGRAIATASSFSSSSLSGNYIIRTTTSNPVCNNGNPCAGVTLGLVNLTSGALSGTTYYYDIDNGGSSSAIPSGATYAVDATSGRVTLSGAGSASALVSYIAIPTATTEPISAFLMATINGGTSADFGFAESQPSQTYSTSGMAGDYFGSTEDPGDNTVSNEIDVVSISSGGTVTGSGDKSGPKGLATESVSGTVSIGSNGVGNMGSNTVAITNGTKILFIDQGAAGGDPAVVTVYERQ